MKFEYNDEHEILTSNGVTYIGKSEDVWNAMNKVNLPEPIDYYAFEHDTKQIGINVKDDSILRKYDDYTELDYSRYSNILKYLQSQTDNELLNSIFNNIRTYILKERNIKENLVKEHLNVMNV